MQILCVCLGFSTGGLLSLDAAEYCDDFVLSVVYGNDIVPRLGIRTMEKLKYAVMDAIKDSKSPKVCTNQVPKFMKSCPSTKNLWNFGNFSIKSSLAHSAGLGRPIGN